MKKLVFLLLLPICCASQPHEAWWRAGVPALHNVAWMPFQKQFPAYNATTSVPYGMLALQTHQFAALLGKSWGAGAGTWGMRGWRTNELQFFAAGKVSSASWGARLLGVQRRIEGMPSLPLQVLAELGAVVTLNQKLRLDAHLVGISLLGGSASPQATLLLQSEHAQLLQVWAGISIRGTAQTVPLVQIHYKCYKRMAVMATAQGWPMQIGAGCTFSGKALSTSFLLQRHAILGFSPTITLRYGKPYSKLK
jgi:hypothetical protein